MTSGAAAGRYARALFDVVFKESPASLEPVLADLEGLTSVFTGNAILANALGNPAIPIAKKMTVTRAVLDRAGNIASPLAKMILMLAERDRVMILPDITRIYRDRLMDHQKIIRGEVTTAVAIAPAKLQALQQGLERATGRKVVLQAKIDPSIIGGVVARLGSTVYDGSVTTQLAKMKQSLTEAAR